MGNNTVALFVVFRGGWSCKAESDGTKERT